MGEKDERPKMKIRRAKPEDAKRCSEISRIRTADELVSLLGRSDVRWLVIENQNMEVAGIGIIHLSAWNKVVWVWDLTIEEKERDKGYGTALLKGMIKEARQMGGLVLMDFDAAKPGAYAELYIHNGFRICGINDRWFAHKYPTAVFYGYDL
ncbi:MAG: GNAT family N-acetyltransferase [Planctomycetota bacterium]|jgi:GNAT superfamily N-acetyltransferase